jgi:hypothetical protein
MGLDKYDYKTDKTYLEYEFISDGPKGKITKIVRYTKISGDEITFNLGFGDKNEKTDFIDDLVVSGNNDRDKVLATVASTILDFFSKYPDCTILARGTTPSRTRLYQMAICSNLEYINQLFYVSGLNDERWDLFQKNVNYEAFLVMPKYVINFNPK